MSRGQSAKTRTPKPGVAVEMQPALRRILAPNPSPMTYHGTNTYLLGQRDIAVIDPGPPEDTHLDAIMNALGPHQRISHILVTHSHIDHSPLAMVLAQITGARIYAFGHSKAGRSPVMDRLGDIGGGEGVDESFQPDIALKDGEPVTGSDWSLIAHHTPGHMGNHLCFEWLEGAALFSGDHVMGWASSMVSPPDGDLTAFMGALDKLRRVTAPQLFYPGHGDPVEVPQSRVEELYAHRRQRERQILAALAQAPGTPAELAARIYTEVDPRLLPAAERNVLAHLIDLHGKAQVTCGEEIAKDAIFTLS